MDYPSYQETLRTSGGSAEFISELLIKFRHLELKKDEHILIPGDIFQYVYIIKSGALRLYYLSPEGGQFNKQFFFEGDIVFPLAPVARNNPSLFGIVSCKPAVLQYLPLVDFECGLQSENVWESFYKVYLEWLANIKVIREAQLLSLSSFQRVQTVLQNEPEIVNRIPDYHIASYLGISPVTFSRLKHQYTRTERRKPG